MEDFSGAAEFVFFGDDWVGKKNYFAEGMFLYLIGKCQPRKWQPDEWEVKINGVKLLSDVKDDDIQKITVSVPLSFITNEFVLEFSELIRNNPGKVDLSFVICDDDGQNRVSMQSRTMKVSLKKDIVIYIKNRPQLDYKIN